jgi:DNA-binding NtrC family response regulator
MGTGKTLLAEKLHGGSLRRLAPFVEVHCNALTDAQVERELFAGGGAVQEVKGGTLLLSDLARCSTPLQGKLVRVLGGCGSERPDGEQAIEADFRLVVANTVSGDDSAAPAACREALRLLSPVKVVLPPLRDRCADIPLLVRHFACVLSRRHERRAPRIMPDALESLVHHSWPGNVRELKNAVQHAVMLAEDGVIRREHLPESVNQARRAAPGEDPPDCSLNLEPAMRQAERRYLLHALRLCQWNKRKAAQELQISRSTLYKKVKQHGLKKLAARGGPESAAGTASG